MTLRVVPPVAQVASASAVAPRVALLRIGRVLVTAEAPRAAGLRPTVEELGIGEALRIVVVHRIGEAPPIAAVHRVGETLRILEVHRPGETLRLVAVFRIGGAAPVEVAPGWPISIGQLIAPRDAKLVLQSGIRPWGDGGRVRASGPADHDLPVRLVAMMKMLVAAWPPSGEEVNLALAANRPHTAVDRPGIDRRQAKAGAGRRRNKTAVMPNTRNLMSRRMATQSPRHVMVTDVASAAKKGSGFRRRFREPVLRLVVRLKIGLEPGVSLSTAN